MRRPTEVPDVLGIAFTTRMAESRGLPRSSFAQPGLERPHHGVLLRVRERDRDDSSADTLRLDTLRRARAAALALPAHAFFCGRTAAVILGLPLPSEPDADAPLDAAVFHPHRGPRTRGVRSRQVRQHLASVVERDGLRVSSPSTTWAMLAPELDLDDLVAVGDAILRIPRHPGGFARSPGAPMATVDQLRAAADAGPRSGVARLRDALHLVSTRSSSRPETKTRLLIGRAGLPAPTLDHDVYSRSGEFLGCSEIAFPAFRVAVECEGDHHRTSRRQWNRDIDKYAHYTEAGWEVVRLTSTLVWARPEEGMRRIRSALVRRGWRP